MERDTTFRSRREGLWPFLVVTLACLAAIALVGLAHDRRAHELVAREDAALDALRRVAAAEGAYREQAGRYGWLADLERAGLLQGLEVRGGEDPHVRAADYRIDVLLPTVRLGPEEVQIAPQGEQEPDPALAEQHFAAVARPLAPGVSGFRSWYLDEKGELYLNEGVLDREGLALNALPLHLVRSSEAMGSPSPMLWQHAATLQKD
jgi:hypothetical protein